MIMYYYAYIDPDTGFCHDVIESDIQIEDPYYVEVSGFSNYSDYCKYYKMRKTYENGEWRDTTVEEAERYNAPIMAEHLTVGDEWLDVALDGKAPLDHTHDGYATEDHVHTGYVSADDLQALEDVVDTKADATHTHSEYASVNHSHDGYATTVALDTLSEEVDGKADSVHSHSEYALSSHEHDNYADANHNHDSSYASQTDFDILETEVNSIEEFTVEYIESLFPEIA